MFLELLQVRLNPEGRNLEIAAADYLHTRSPTNTIKALKKTNNIRRLHTEIK